MTNNDLSSEEIIFFHVENGTKQKQMSREDQIDVTNKMY